MSSCLKSKTNWQSEMCNKSIVKVIFVLLVLDVIQVQCKHLQRIGYRRNRNSGKSLNVTAPCFAIENFSPKTSCSTNHESLKVKMLKTSLKIENPGTMRFHLRNTCVCCLSGVVLMTIWIGEKTSFVDFPFFS